jgi:hypothetical protein
MASQNRPASRKLAPDPATSYERAKPEKEAGAGRLDNNVSTPTNQPGREQQTVKNRQDPCRQINAEECDNLRDSADPNRAMPPPDPADHSKEQEQPLGWDQAPTGKMPARDKRQPRTKGKGGTPDATDA